MSNDDEDRNDGKDSRPDEIDPTPERKAAKSDRIDMDDDGFERLSEAHARLTNKEGKKVSLFMLSTAIA